MRRLVVDASVAASAGTSDHPESSHCRNFLEVLQRANHALVMTAAIMDEWKLFQGRFAAAWFAAMVSRGRVHWLKPQRDLKLRHRIGTSSRDSALIKIMLDDLHLVEAALDSDSLIASKDNEALTAFCSASATIAELRGICWLNPVTEGAEALVWLKGGAKPNARIRLRVIRSAATARRPDRKPR